MAAHRQMLGVLGHELRTPLCVLRVSIESLRRCRLTVEQSEDVLSRITRNLQRIDRLVSDVSCQAAGSAVHLQRQRADLRLLLLSAAQETQLRWPGRVTDLHVDSDATGNWDVDRLHQLASNVLGNALENGHMHSPVEVRVSGDPRGDLTIEVHNQGPVIPPEELERIFEPFQRGRSQARAGGHLGLGLFIARQVAEAHGGSIWASNSADEGTRFTISLPRGAPPHEVSLPH